MNCPKCKGEMEKGFICDKTDMSFAGKQDWGTKITFFGFLGSIKDRKEVNTFRCKDCGYLESFAK